MATCARLRRPHLPGHWWAASVLLFVATVTGTGLLVALLLRSPLRWVLPGPVRSRERAVLPAYPPGPAVPLDAIASATASAMTM